MSGNNTAVSMAMTARTHTISSRVKPRSASSLILCAGHVFGRNIGGDSRTPLLPIGSVGHDFVGAAFARRTVDIRIVPGIVGDVAALEIRSIPGGDSGSPLHQGRQTLGCRWKPAGIEIKQIEGATETLQLDLRG